MLKILLASFKAHWGQKDKGGKPYIFHPLRVAFHSKGKDAKIVALLHGVLEDTDYDIHSLNLNNDQLEALNLLTKDEKMSYKNYIQKIKKNPIT